MLKREETDADQQSNQSVIHYNVPPRLLGQLAKAQHALETSILKFEPVIGQLEERWEQKVQYRIFNIYVL